MPSSSLTQIKKFLPWILILVSALIAVVAYLQGINAPFFYDDEMYITQNARLLELQLPELWRLFVEPYNEFFEFLPLRELSYWVDLKLFGLTPAAFRLHHIVLYLLSLPLVYGVTFRVWRYFRPVDVASATWAAAIVTALFSLHPTLIEPVLWVSGRKYILPNFFSFLALWLALKAKQDRDFNVLYACAALGAFVAVMLSKANYVPVAVIIALLWFFFWRDILQPHRRRALLLWPVASLLLAAILLGVFIAKGAGLGDVWVPFYFGIEAATRTLSILGWLVQLAITPQSRHFFYPVFEDPWLPAMVALGVITLAIVGWGAVAMLRRRSLEGFALTAFLLLCLPYLQIMPYSPPTLVSDRFLALAIWPVLLLIVSLAWRLKPVPRAALLLAIALPWIFQTVERPRDWRSFEALLDADLRTYPGFYAPALLKITDFQVSRQRHDEAITTANSITIPEAREVMLKLIKADHAVLIESASSGDPRVAMDLLWDWGLSLHQMPIQTKWNLPLTHVWRMNKVILGLEWEYLSSHFPDDALVHYKAGLWMLADHKYEQAATHLRAATESQLLPQAERGMAFYSLGMALLNKGNLSEAESALRAALLQSPPTLQAHCLLADAYKQMRRFEDATTAQTNCSRMPTPN
ncbi:MAG: hypothetical protein Q7S51_01185 [Gallionellaceae bacterium]|nr:hypothetical protein [Gallionellaceae bacterium]